MIFSVTYPATENSDAEMDRAVCPKVYDGEMREISELRVERVVHELGKPSRAELALLLDGNLRRMTGSGEAVESPRGFEAAARPGEVAVRLGEVVHVGIDLGEQVLVIFRGRLADLNASAQASDESALAVALGPEAALDEEEILGRLVADASGIGATDEPAVFNAGNLGNYDPAGSAREGMPLFGLPSADPSCLWRVGTFWRYVVGSCFSPRDARLPAGNVTPELAAEDDVVLAATDVDGRRASAALAKVLGECGLDWWADPFALVGARPSPGAALPCFRIVTPASAPVKPLMLQAGGETFSPDATNVDAASVTFTSSGSSGTRRAEGDRCEYEAAWELVGLWTDDEMTEVASNPDKGDRADGNYVLTLDHVARQWGLNEDGRWTDRPTFDFAGAVGGGVWSARRRRFFAPYSAAGGSPRRFVIEIRSDALPDDDWHRVASGNVRLLTDRCGVYFDLVDVHGTNATLLADTGDHVGLLDVSRVRITAIVKSDERVSVSASGASGGTSRVLHDSSLRRVVRDASSAYVAEGAGVILNDAAAGGMMSVLASRAGRTPAKGKSSRVSVPWVDLSLRVGDCISGIDGRDLSLASESADAAGPLVERATYDFERQTTQIDLRMPG